MKGWIWIGIAMAAMGCSGQKAASNEPLRPASAKEESAEFVGRWTGEAKSEKSKPRSGHSIDQAVGGVKGMSPSLLSQLGGYELELERSGTYKFNVTGVLIEGKWVAAASSIRLEPDSVGGDKAADIRAKKPKPASAYLAEAMGLSISADRKSLHLSSQNLQVKFTQS